MIAIQMNARPHPEPLPQARENRPAATSALAHFGLVLDSAKHWNLAPTANESSGLAVSAVTLSLSPGEWVGVKASVKTDYVRLVRPPEFNSKSFGP